MRIFFTGSFSYNGFVNGFVEILPVFDSFDDEFGGVQIQTDSQSGWRPIEDIIRSSAPLLEVSGGLIACVVAKLLPKKHLQQTWHGVPKKYHIHIFIFISKVAFHLVTRFSGVLVGFKI